MADVIALPVRATRVRAKSLPVAKLLNLWCERRRERAEFRRLLRTGMYLLRDIGITPEQAAAEVAKPFWLP